MKNMDLLYARTTESASSTSINPLSRLDGRTFGMFKHGDGAYSIKIVANADGMRAEIGAQDLICNHVNFNEKQKQAYLDRLDERVLNEGHALVVLQKTDSYGQLKVIGALSGDSNPHLDGAFNIRNLVLDKDFQDKGIGQAFLSSFAEICNSVGIGRLLGSISEKTQQKTEGKKITHIVEDVVKGELDIPYSSWVKSENKSKFYESLKERNLEEDVRKVQKRINTKHGIFFPGL